MKKHRSEIIRWADAPEATGVWFKRQNELEWILTAHPSWNTDLLYIVDDKHAKIRKQFLDDPTRVEWHHYIDDKWVATDRRELDSLTKFLDMGHRYRVKPKTVTMWKWVIKDILTNEHRISNGYYVDGSKSKFHIFVCKIEETEREFEV